MSRTVKYSVADPGIFKTLYPKSGYRMGKKSGSGINIPDYFSESLETVFRVKNT
jgi:hypothetical protein